MNLYHRNSIAKRKKLRLHCPGIEPGVGRWQRPMLPLHQQCGETGTALQTLRFVRCHVSCVGNEILSIYITK